MQWHGLILIIAGVLLGIAGGVFLAKVVCFAPKKGFVAIVDRFFEKDVAMGFHVGKLPV